MDVGSSQLIFPSAFCCNCGALDCQSEVQDTRVSRYFGVRNGATTFNLPVPVCARCRRSTRRRPPGFLARLLLLGTCLAVAALLFELLDYSLFDSRWLPRHVLVAASILAVVAFVILTRLRRPKPPQTSFYQPVRIKSATVAVSHVEGAVSRVTFMKLAFTNPDYLNVCRNANQAAIDAGSIAVTSARN
jgi:hypothetical protein